MNTATQQWNAEDYAANSSAQYAWGRELIDRLPLRGNEHILDIGCGDGKLTARLAQRVAQGSVTGIDASPAMITFARERWGDEARLDFQKQDGQQLHAAAHFAGRFDRVFSNSALHWMQDHPAVLAGIRHSLRTGGQLWMQTPAEENCASILRATAQACTDPRWQTRFEEFSAPWLFCNASDYARWLPQADLQVERLSIIRRSVDFDNRSALSGWLRTTWLPYQARLPDAQRAAFIETIVDNYLSDNSGALSNNKNAAGGICVEMVRLEVIATAVEAA